MKASRLGRLKRVRGGEKVIIRARERKTDLLKQTLKVILIMTRAYESRLACQKLISN